MSSAEENSKDPSEHERLAVFVRPQNHTLPAELVDAVCRRFEDDNKAARLTLQLDSDFDQGAVSLHTGKQDVLTEEDVFDTFFLPDLLKAIGTDTAPGGVSGAKKSIIELIQEAEEETIKSWRKRCKQKEFGYCKEWTGAHETFVYKGTITAGRNSAGGIARL